MPRLFFFGTKCAVRVHVRQIQIGTSGWHYKHWLGNFYPAEMKAPEMLRHYLKFFDTVELNNTFYHLPAEASFEGWRRGTPADFRFAVKGSRFITHMKKLNDVEEATWRFLGRAEILGRKLGPILFQLPPNLKINLERLETFLRLLPKTHRYTFEFREKTWMHEETYDLLRSFNAAYCIYEIEYYQSPIIVTADWTYVRLHGPGSKYQGLYGKKGLQPWKQRIEQWRTELKGIYFYFDNDQAGYAAADAQMLNRMIAPAAS